MSKIKQSGKIAFEAGLKKSDCGFAMNSSARRSWLRGWNAAYKEKSEYDRKANLHQERLDAARAIGEEVI